ncbi:hypothetical protein RJT34_02936 [Clitoria ternatea]|uniref:Uncharacterized protein n=1 Tax=Clitoria ternatea TaxID=43366 RepID=A0AAN9KIV0_CLITE
MTAEKVDLRRQCLRWARSLRICRFRGLLGICRCRELEIVWDQLRVHNRRPDLCLVLASGFVQVHGEGSLIGPRSGSQGWHGQRPTGSEAAWSAVPARTVAVR